jgi:hypothetical protein
MVRRSFQPVLWLLMFVQGIGLCRCLVAQATGLEHGVVAWVADGVADNHQDRPAEQIACDTKVSVKASSEQSNLFVALLTPTVAQILPSPSCVLVLPVEPAFSLALPHEGRNLPLLI